MKKLLLSGAAIAATLAFASVASADVLIGVAGPNAATIVALIQTATTLPMVLLFGLAERLTTRMLIERAHHPGAEAKRAIVVGAGYMGTKLIHWMSSDRLSTFAPVALVDDDLGKRNMMVRNIRVLGGVEDIARVAEETQATVVVVAIRDASPELLRRIQDIAQPLNLNVKILPPIAEAVEKGLAKTDLRDLRIEDLLGRPVVNTNVGEIAGYLSNRRVLVTGAGGSIGSQLCVEIKKYGPSELIMLDRDETGRFRFTAVARRSSLSRPDGNPTRRRKCA